MLNKEIRLLAAGAGLLLGLTSFAQAALVKYTFEGYGLNPYAAGSPWLDDPRIPGAFAGFRNQIRAELFFDESIANATNGYLSVYPGTRFGDPKPNFGLSLSDGRHTLPALGSIIHEGSRMHLVNGIPQEWFFSRESLTSDLFLAEGQQWLQMSMTRSVRDQVQRETSRIYQCVAGCSPPGRNPDRETVWEQAATDNYFSDTTGRLVRTTAAALEPATFGWVRQPGLYEQLPDGTYASVVPVPAAVWLFGSGLLGLIGVSRRRTNAKEV